MSGSEIAQQESKVDEAAVATVADRIAAIRQRSAEITGDAFTALLRQGADDVLLTREVRDKDSLINVPFFVTKVSFNPGIGGSDFASVEISPADGEPCVINDGSTGIRRQLVDFLMRKGLIHPGESVTDPATGEVFNALDNPIGSWTKGQETAHAGFGPFTYLIPRGLRVSRYPNPVGGGDSETFYLS